MHFGTGLYLVRTLALCGEVLLYGQVNGVVVRLDAEDIIRQIHRAAGFLSLYV
jgi:hypothetical protein